ncbi:hypothetical protein FHS16_002532 [Paenibacillus endophyticus]|uniref:Uncharacterized protein n=1 Tax=Paenibacillus endophyticus TaxID=1294268 RepID=A0A7W5C7L1_9BACL|nr:hypothetical protein [Paenibacillus endophyticus]MBB3152482.1 hypothetical protein [Paenibacillus endophyticus]
MKPGIDAELVKLVLMGQESVNCGIAGAERYEVDERGICPVLATAEKPIKGIWLSECGGRANYLFSVFP